MSECIFHTPYTGPVKAVILDWAGTAVDYGCMGPAAVFVRVFENFGVTASVADARQFMGLEKKQHIRQMCKLPGIENQWHKRHGRIPGKTDVDALFVQTEPMMVDTISEHSDPIDGLLPFVETMRRRNIAIGSCTGYTAPMMAVLAAEAAKKGYSPNCVVCSSDVPAGRPFPWMCYLNAIQLQVYPFESMIKIGDTISDIREGRNAGMWTVGLTQSGNELGLTEDLVDALSVEELEKRLGIIENSFRKNGAHYVVRGIWECLEVVEDIQQRLEKGEHPLLHK
jgi:phosphonoacetaldehyde hydrolase